MGTITINGKKVEFTNEKNILTIIRNAGIEVPTLCYQPELSIFGACRLCTVEDDRGRCFIGIDPSLRDGSVRERVHLSHELGHCVTGSFYNIHDAVDCRQRHENRADKWAIDHLIPVADLDAAVAQGCTEIWELAEYFTVTEDLVRFACYEYFDKR